MLEAIDNDPSMKSVVTWITDIEYQNPPFGSDDIGGEDASKDDKNKKKKDGSTSTSKTYYDGFVVYNRGRFESEIIPKYLLGNKGKKFIKYRSFVRQLNLYGFERINYGAYRGAYFHRLWKRGYPDLCNGIDRVGSRQVSPIPPPLPSASQLLTEAAQQASWMAKKMKNLNDSSNTKNVSSNTATIPTTPTIRQQNDNLTVHEAISLSWNSASAASRQLPVTRQFDYYGGDGGIGSGGGLSHVVDQAISSIGRVASSSSSIGNDSSAVAAGGAGRDGSGVSGARTIQRGDDSLSSMSASLLLEPDTIEEMCLRNRNRLQEQQQQRERQLQVLQQQDIVTDFLNMFNNR